MRNIIIHAGNISMEAELNDTSTADTILDALPLEGEANLWGGEIYFEIPVDMELAPDAGDEVEIGELGYWPTGGAFCIFFGPTPVSTNNKPKAASAVNVFGRIKGDATIINAVESGTAIIVEKGDD